MFHGFSTLDPSCSDDFKLRETFCDLGGRGTTAESPDLPWERRRGVGDTRRGHEVARRGSGGAPVGVTVANRGDGALE